MNKAMVIAHYGSKTKLAQALNITLPSISQWGDRVPEKRAIQLDWMTRGALRYDPAAYAKHQ
ncbi:Cro/CI family transcriptional regulator [Oceanobacter sp. 3_MG-2023]|uniref:Cro/CI family transcriptional regulator n=1 Tax=Oceanobacter sp. 3_MG-2023 TaxID=3062622 RepID=UPI002736FAFE|nr:Cro/CI family transcriptional regulator [Oceanobacter sp. 3_MG-2023]MDP2505407.1 Cro/CI family transcriptional regulator [Oceanobacter sp. 3_MG-2023]